MTDVFGCGPIPCPVFLCGEAPGAHEAQLGRPFVGPSGAEQERYLSRHRLSARSWYRTNICKTYTPGNPDPSPQQIDFWTPILFDELARVAPRLIIAVGQFATRWFLGDTATLDLCHGRPHTAGVFDPSRADRSGPNNAPVLPVYHPAARFRNPDVWPLILADYDQVAHYVKLVQRGQAIDIPHDEHAGNEQYFNVTGHDIASLLMFDTPAEIGLDTEGLLQRPWSLQLSWHAGSGYVLRCDQPDFANGIENIQHYLDTQRPLIVVNNAMHDIGICRAMGLDLRRVRMWDNRYAAYLLRTEPQGLKPGAWRWCGMHMDSFDDVVGDTALSRRLEYLNAALDIAKQLPKPAPIEEFQNDGTIKVVRPSPIKNLINRLLKDVADDVRNKNGEPVDIRRRWNDFRPHLRQPVEKRLGKLPGKSLADVPLSRAVYYAARDADGSLRLKPQLEAQLSRYGLLDLMHQSFVTLPIFEQMQHNGMPASRKALQRLSDELFIEYIITLDELSSTYFDGQLINPKSNSQTRKLLQKRGIRGVKRTARGEMSTAKKSIEQFRYLDPAVDLLFKCREVLDTKNRYVDTELARFPEGADLLSVRGQLLPTKIPTRRLAGKAPNLLAQPKHSIYGKRLRGCYLAPDGYLFYTADLSQIEMRVLADHSQDPLLLDVYRNNRDIHAETGSRIFGLPPDQLDKDKHRYPAKTTNFSVVYGTGAFTLWTVISSRVPGWTVESCQKVLIDGFYRTYPGVLEYKKKLTAKVRETGTVRDVSGMMRHLPGIWSSDSGERAEAERIAVSHAVSGTAQTLLQNSMAHLGPQILDLQDAGHDIRWLLQIHDELVFLCPESDIALLDAFVLDAMTNHCGVDLLVPVRAESAWGKTWRDV